MPHFHRSVSGVGGGKKAHSSTSFLTTVFSDEHQQYFRHCWPSLLSRSTLLQGADVLIFSNNKTEVDGSIIAFVHELFANNPSFGIRFLSPSALLEISKPSNRGAWLRDTYKNVFQLGANEAVRLGFSEGWFSPYDWVIRINPDVLIRRSKWLLETMEDPSVDGIFVECSKEPWKIHTDFFVVRPSACRPDAFSDLVEDVFDGRGNHEMTATKEFRPIIEADRHRWLPDNDDSRTRCRVRGSNSTVAHNHDAVRQSAHGNWFAYYWTTLRLTERIANKTSLQQDPYELCFGRKVVLQESSFCHAISWKDVVSVRGACVEPHFGISARGRASSPMKRLQIWGPGLDSQAASLGVFHRGAPTRWAALHGRGGWTGEILTF